MDFYWEVFLYISGGLVLFCLIAISLVGCFVRHRFTTPKEDRVYEGDYFENADSIPFCEGREGFPCFFWVEPLQNSRFAAVSSGRLLRILDTSTRKYIFSYLHHNYIYRIAELDDDRLALLCDENDVVLPGTETDWKEKRDHKEAGYCFVDILRISCLKSFSSRTRTKEVEIIQHFKVNAIYINLDTNWLEIMYFKTYGKRYVELAFRLPEEGKAVIIDTRTERVKRFIIYKTDYTPCTHRNPQPDKLYRIDENLLIQTIGDRVYLFPLFNSKKKLMGEQNFLEILGLPDPWKLKTHHDRYMSSFYFPMREHDNLIPKEIAFCCQEDDFILRVDRSGDDIAQASYLFRTKLDPNGDDFRKTSKSSGLFISKMNMPDEEHNPLMISISDRNRIIVTDIRTMRTLERMKIPAFDLKTTPLCLEESFNFVIKGSEIFLYSMNYSRFYVLNSRVLCNTKKLDERVGDLQTLLSMPIKKIPFIKYFTRFFDSENRLIFEFPTSLLPYELRDYRNRRRSKNQRTYQDEGEKRIRNLTCSKLNYELTVPKVKLTKMLLGYRVILTPKEKVDIFCFFREFRMAKRMWVLLRQIRYEDQFNSTKLKHMFLIMYRRYERDWYFGVPKTERIGRAQEFRPEALGTGKYFHTSLSFKLFKLLWTLREFVFLKRVLQFQELKRTNQTNTVYQWKKYIEQNIKFHKSSRKRGKLREHPDFFGYMRAEFPCTNVTATIYNLGVLKIDQQSVYLKNLTIQSRERKRKFRVHFEVIFTRSVLLHQLIKQKYWDSMLNGSFFNNNNNNTITLDEVLKDEDLECILHSIYSRDARSERLRKKYPLRRSLLGLFEGNVSEMRSKARVIHLANLYCDHDLLVDYQYFRDVTIMTTLGNASPGRLEGYVKNHENSPLGNDECFVYTVPRNNRKGDERVIFARQFGIDDQNEIIFEPMMYGKWIFLNDVAMAKSITEGVIGFHPKIRNEILRIQVFDEIVKENEEKRESAGSSSSITNNSTTSSEEEEEEMEEISGFAKLLLEGLGKNKEMRRRYFERKRKMRKMKKDKEDLVKVEKEIESEIAWSSEDEEEDVAVSI